MPVAEEVHFLFPEGEWALNRIAGDPAHELFKRYGEQVPAEDWNTGGTKQGVYLMGPNGEYLEGAHAASGRADHLRWRMERALERWAELEASAGYAGRPVPLGDAVAPPEVEEAPLALRVSLRDLPRADDPDAGRRVTQRDRRDRRWSSFKRWAWNQNWLTLEDPGVLLPPTLRKRSATGPLPDEVGPWQDLDRRFVERLAREVLVDNVRGQTPRWPASAVRVAELEARVLGTAGDLCTLEYRGRAHLETDAEAHADELVAQATPASYAPALFGQATWNSRTREFVALTLVAAGERTGAGAFNQRRDDLGPAPMGIVLDLHVPRATAAEPSLKPPGLEPAGER